MKKLLVLITIFCSIVKTYADDNTITWFGVDFSKAKMIGTLGFAEPAKIQSYFLNDWNDVIVIEAEKYNLAKFYKKATVKNSLDVVKEHNNKVAAATLVTDNIYALNSDDAQKVVAQYKGKGTGTGLVFVVEAFSKTAEEANIYVA